MFWMPRGCNLKFLLTKTATNTINALNMKEVSIAFVMAPSPMDSAAISIAKRGTGRRIFPAITTANEMITNRNIFSFLWTITF